MLRCAASRCNLRMRALICGSPSSCLISSFSFLLASFAAIAPSASAGKRNRPRRSPASVPATRQRQAASRCPRPAPRRRPAGVASDAPISLTRARNDPAGHHGDGRDLQQHQATHHGHAEPQTVGQTCATATMPLPVAPPAVRSRSGSRPGPGRPPAWRQTAEPNSSPSDGQRSAEHAARRCRCTSSGSRSLEGTGQTESHRDIRAAAAQVLRQPKTATPIAGEQQQPGVQVGADGDLALFVRLLAPARRRRLRFLPASIRPPSRHTPIASASSRKLTRTCRPCRVHQLRQQQKRAATSPTHQPQRKADRNTG